MYGASRILVRLLRRLVAESLFVVTEVTESLLGVVAAIEVFRGYSLHPRSRRSDRGLSPCPRGCRSAQQLSSVSSRSPKRSGSFSLSSRCWGFSRYPRSRRSAPAFFVALVVAEAVWTFLFIFGVAEDIWIFLAVLAVTQVLGDFPLSSDS